MWVRVRDRAFDYYWFSKNGIVIFRWTYLSIYDIYDICDMIIFRTIFNLKKKKIGYGSRQFGG